MDTSFLDITRWYDVLGFSLPAIFSWCFVDKFIQEKHRVVLERNWQFADGGVQKDVYLKIVKHKLHLSYGMEIGKLERLIYIFTVIVGDYSLIGGWLVLKAFFGWIRGDAKGDCNDSSVKLIEGSVVMNNGDTFRYDVKRAEYHDLTIVEFYLYIYGNCLSLICGLGLGVVAKYISLLFSKLW